MYATFTGKRASWSPGPPAASDAVALRLAAEGAELYLTDVNADGLAETVGAATASGATVAEHRALDIDYKRGRAVRRGHPQPAPAMDVVLNIAGVSAWNTVDIDHQHWRVDGRRQPDK